MSSCDFAECLRTARELDRHAEALKDFFTAHAVPRDAALAEWQGWYGDNLRNSAVDNDDDLRRAIDRVGIASDEWVSVWQREVDKHNDEEFARARDEHRRWLQRQETIASLERADHARFSAMQPGLEVPAIVQWLNAGSPASVDRPRLAARPVNFTPVEAPFAQFTRSGYDLVVAYTFDACSWPAGVLL